MKTECAIFAGRRRVPVRRRRRLRRLDRRRVRRRRVDRHRRAGPVGLLCSMCGGFFWFVVPPHRPAPGGPAATPRSPTAPARSASSARAATGRSLAAGDSPGSAWCSGVVADRARPDPRALRRRAAVRVLHTRSHLADLRVPPRRAGRAGDPGPLGTRCWPGGWTGTTSPSGPPAPGGGDWLVELVRRLSGLHAQAASAAEAAAWLRTAGAVGPADVRAALAEHRTLVKTWTVRGTLHLLPAADLPRWAAALGTRSFPAPSPGTATTASPPRTWPRSSRPCRRCSTAPR